MLHHTVLLIYAGEYWQIPFLHFLAESTQVDFASQQPPFSFQSSGIPTIQRQASGQNPEYIPKIDKASWVDMEWTGFVFPTYERRYLFFNTSMSCWIKKNISERLWVGIRISHLAGHVPWKFRVFGKWRGTGKLVPRKPCVTTRVVKGSTWSQRTPSIEDLREHQDLCGKHHQVARALEAVTISNMTTTEEPQVEEKQPVEKKVVGECRCAAKVYVAYARLKATSRTCAP